MNPAKKNKFLIVFSSTLILASIIIIVSYLPTIQKPKIGEIFQAQPVVGSLSLSVNPDTIEVGATDTTSLGISLDTGGEEVSGADIVLPFNSSFLQVTGITPSQTTTLQTFAPLNDTQDAFDWTKAVDQGTGKIEFGVVTFDLPGQVPTNSFNGTASLANITLQAKPLRQTTTLQLNLSAQDQNTTDSNIAGTVEGNDILATVNPTTLKVKAEAVCRAAVNLSDPVPNLNDLIQIVNKGWDSNCPDCLEDLNEDGRINLGDLMFVINYWEQSCPAP